MVQLEVWGLEFGVKAFIAAWHSLIKIDHLKKTIVAVFASHEILHISPHSPYAYCQLHSFSNKFLYK